MNKRTQETKEKITLSIRDDQDTQINTIEDVLKID